jgi:predicted HTH transcriptional regulator
MIELNEQDILSRLKNTEDSTVERKTAADYRDCLKTAVGFSNSLPVDDPGIIFVGVFDDGRVQENNKLDSLQKDVSKELSKIYPPIEPQLLVRRDAGGKEFLAVIVRGSPSRPHFAGTSFIRNGSQTLPASEQQFSELIAARNSKVSRILSFKRKIISATNVQHVAGHTSESNWGGTVRIYYCDQFFVTLSTGPEPKDRVSFPLNMVEISFDDEHNRLLLRILRS